MKETYNYLRSKVKDTTIVVGVSGGPDSMSLLHILNKLKNELNIKIVVCSVNHNTGRKGQKEEYDYVEKYSKENDLIFEGLTIENYGDDNFHNEARTIRYNFFSRMMDKYHAKYMMTAHHADDLMETILMRIVRGSTLRGYAGFAREFSLDGYVVLRPLLPYTKDEIKSYADLNNITYFVDSSNEKTVYTRNRYRKYILPELKKEDAMVHKKFLKYSETLLMFNDYIDGIVKEKIDTIYKDKMLNIDLFNKEEKVIKEKIIQYILENIYDDDLMLVNDHHTMLIMDLINSRKANASVYLPNNIVVTKEYNKLFFSANIYESKDYEIEIIDYVCLPNGKEINRVESVESDSNFVCRLNSNDVCLPLHVRNRREGDKMIIKGLNGSKKIKDIFINEKISLRDRDLWPVVVDSKGVIVWLPGLKKSKFDKQKDEIYDIILKYS